MRNSANQRGEVCFAIIVLLFLIFFPALCNAQIFKYVDKDGVVHFTNIPIVPAKPLPMYSKLQPSIATRSEYSIYPKVGASLPFSPYCNIANQRALDPQIRMSCLRHGMDHTLVRAVISAESAFNPQAISPKGASGLMQLMPDTSRNMGVLDPFNPYDNIEGGTRYLRILLDRFNNDVSLALAAYNAGPETVEKYGGIPPYEETQTYVQRVLQYWDHYKR